MRRNVLTLRAEEEVTCERSLDRNLQKGLGHKKPQL